ncbi:hypothetical protein [Chitinophaga nivalis]|uniref:DUF4136 domain-containing protein n=1 Tax=Chitinophaga nivalis TaxID=2991709 RepID=A0ABT3ILG9_9BACT|nr:hypothetical protein [Chitinophaga nivalis]MCW3465510.1 hypothetical protein [Chitinophaga nivalis]MCW3484799.1 hypothetical protein [Chitinophaga nivalis]
MQTMMFRFSYGKWLVATLLGCLIAGCGTSVHMTGTWKSPDAAATGYHEILVVALSSNIGAKSTVETRLENALKKKGIVAGKSLDLFPPDFDPKDDAAKVAARQKILTAGYRAVLTVSLVDKASDTRYVPGSVLYAPYPAYGWYGSFWGYYGYMRGAVYSPGYYTTDKTYFLESNLYDLTEDGKLVWSGQSETYNPNSLESFAGAYASNVVYALQQAGLLRK